MWGFYMRNGTRRCLFRFRGKNYAQHFLYCLYRKLVKVNNITLLSLFKEMKHFELKYNCHKVLGLGKVEQRSGGKTYLLSSFQKRIGQKNSEDVTRDTPYLIQDNRTFFQHISVTVYYFILN